MKTLKFSNTDEWMSARKGRITGSTVKDIIVKRGTGKKLGFYQQIADRLSMPEEGEENPMQRGSRLETEAVELLSNEVGKKFDTSLVIWHRDDNESIAISPDAFSGKKIAGEIKCLGSAYHIKALLTQQVPKEYEDQMIQYFVVNDDLEVLYFTFYDPRLTVKPFFYIKVNRKDVQKKVDEYLLYQTKELEEINKIVNKLTF